MMNRNSNAAGGSVALMLLSVVLFAVSTLLIRGLALEFPAVDGWMASLFRGVVGMAFVGAIFGFGRGLKLGRVFTRPLLLMRGLVGAVSIVAFYVTVVHLGAARAVLISLSYPIFATIIGALTLGERPTLRAFLWMLAGFGGLLVFLGSDLDGGVSGYDLLAVAGAVGAGVVVVLIRALRREEHSATIYSSQCVFGMMITVPVVGGRVHEVSLPAIGYLSLAAVVVAIAQLAMTHAYRELSVSRGSAIQMLLPLTTGLGGFIIFGETFTVLELVGGGIVMVAAWRVLAQRVAPTSGACATETSQTSLAEAGGR